MAGLSDRERKALAEHEWAVHAEELAHGISVRSKVLPALILGVVCLAAVVVYAWLTG